MQPLWTTGLPRQAPKEEVKLIATFIPDLLREATQKLFPHAPWLPQKESKHKAEAKSKPSPDRSPKRKKQTSWILRHWKSSSLPPQSARSEHAFILLQRTLSPKQQMPRQGKVEE